MREARDHNEEKDLNVNEFEEKGIIRADIMQESRDREQFVGVMSVPSLPETNIALLRHLDV